PPRPTAPTPRRPAGRSTHRDRSSTVPRLPALVHAAPDGVGTRFVGHRGSAQTPTVPTRLACTAAAILFARPRGTPRARIPPVGEVTSEVPPFIHSHLGGTAMIAKITRDVVEGYLNCRYKGHLKRTGEPGTRSDYEALLLERRAEVRLRATD